MRNYTSKVAADRSIFLIEQKLIDFGASHILKEYDAQKQVSALSFTLMVDRTTLHRVPFRLPANVKAVAKVLDKKAKTWKQQNAVAEQAPKTAWKLMLDWIDVQLALIEMGQADALQVFLPYCAQPGQPTFYEAIKADGYRALPGLPAPKVTVIEQAEDAEFTEGRA